MVAPPVSSHHPARKKTPRTLVGPGETRLERGVEGGRGGLRRSAARGSHQLDRARRAPLSGERSGRPAPAAGSLRGSTGTARRPARTRPGDEAGGHSPPHGRGGRGTDGLGDRSAAGKNAPPGERPDLCEGHELDDLGARELPGRGAQGTVRPGRGKSQRGAGARAGRGSRSPHRHSPLLSHSLGVDRGRRTSSKAEKTTIDSGR